MAGTDFVTKMKQLTGITPDFTVLQWEIPRGETNKDRGRGYISPRIMGETTVTITKVVGQVISQIEIV